MQHLELSLPFRRIIGYPQPLEQRIEVVALVDVVVGTHHAQEDALAKASRPHKKEEIIRLFHDGQKHGLVYVILVFSPELLEVGDSVW